MCWYVLVCVCGVRWCVEMRGCVSPGAAYCSGEVLPCSRIPHSERLVVEAVGLNERNSSGHTADAHITLSTVSCWCCVVLRTCTNVDVRLRV